MRFHKYQGAGNDFVIVAGNGNPAAAWPALAQSICRRQWAVGADGLLVCLPSDRAELRMRMYNPDGTEDMCGNGLRCLALYAVDEGLARGPFRIETLAGDREVEVEARREAAAEVRTAMGRADLRPAAVPVLTDGDRAIDMELDVNGEPVRLTSLSTGTAHSVIFGPRPVDDRFFRVSRVLEHHPLFPQRTSVLWATPVAPSHLSLRIWERGVGETLACGTGACAAAVAARLHGLAGDRVTVDSPGGRLTVDIGPNLELTLTGPAARVFEGDWP